MRQYLKKILQHFPIFYKLIFSSSTYFRNLRDSFFFFSVQRIPCSYRTPIARKLSFVISKAAFMLYSIPSVDMEKAILFVSLQPHAREPRMAEVAYLAGWQPVLIYTGTPPYNISEHFKYHAQVKGMIGLLFAVWLSQIPIVHLFVLTGHKAFLLCLARNRPLILDIYDPCSFMSAATEKQKFLERETIRLADGLTHRDLRLSYLNKKNQYKLPNSNILIVDPLPIVDPFPSKHILTNKRTDYSEIHVVSVGWVGGIGDPADILRTAKALCSAGIHVHIYFSPLQRDVATFSQLQGYWDLKASSKFFHVEQNVYGNAYWERLARYDFGLLPYERDIFNEPPIGATIDYLQGCGSSRLMDYITVNIGVIGSPFLRFQWFLARRYAPVAVPLTKEFLQDPRPILETALQQKLKNVSKDVTRLSNEYTALRLGKFYEQVLALKRSK